jgi:hypothetical protein
MPSVSVDKRKAILKGPGHRVGFDFSDGLLQVHGSGGLRPALENLRFGLLTSQGEFHSEAYVRRQALRVAAPEWLGRGSGLEFSCLGDAHAPQIGLQAFAYEGRPQVFFKLVVKNTTSSRLDLLEMDLLKLVLPERPNLNFATPLKDLSLFRHGWDSWDVSQSIRVRELSGLLVATVDSFLFSQICDLKSGRSTLLGFTGSQNQVGHLKYVWSGDGSRLKEFRAMAEARHWSLQPGETAESEILLLEAGSRGQQALEDYVGLLGQNMGARIAAAVPVGWCSWYFSWGDISEAGILKSLAALAQRQAPVGLIQVDDGWQKEVGDWEPNARFPSGMAALARRVHAAGYQAGLWMAPFLVSERSRTFRQHPDWCIQAAPGQPLAYGRNWGGLNYCLDPTHPGVKQRLMEVLGSVVRSWGFDYLKLDFLHAGAMDGLFHRKGLTRVQAYREGLALLRQLAGDRFLLACGAPIGPSVGFVDAMRIGRDTGPRWDNSYDEFFADLRSKHPRAEPYLRKLGEYLNLPLKGSLAVLRELMVSERLVARWSSLGSMVGGLQDTFCRSVFHRRLWLNDPDCLLLREKDTTLNLAERRSMATAASLAGGLLFLSDDPATLGEAGLEDFRRLVPPVGGPGARPLDLAEHRIPQFFALDLERPWGTWHLVQCCNSADNLKNLELPLHDLGFGPLKRLHIWDVWEEKYLGVHRGRFLQEPLAGHHSRLLCLRPVSGGPQFLGSSLHLSQGGEEFSAFSQGRERIQCRLKALPGPARMGRLYFYLPGKRHVRRVSASQGKAKMSFSQPNVVCVELEASDGNELTLEFGRGA